jgi:phosphoserine phosphatase RsbU/P
MSSALSTVHRDQTYRIKCAEIWGGIENVSADLRTNGIEASIYSHSCEGVAGGDIYHLSVCSHDVLTRILLADLQGHGIEVTQLSRWIYDILRENIDNPDGRSVFASLNPLLHETGVKAITTAVIATFSAADSALRFSNAGHWPPLFKGFDLETYEPLSLVTETKKLADLPLGALEATAYDEGVIHLRRGDRLVFYTDGVTECPSPQEEEFGECRLRGVLEEDAAAGISVARDRLVAALVRHAGGSLTYDDTTFMLVRAL